MFENMSYDELMEIVVDRGEGAYEAAKRIAEMYRQGIEVDLDNETAAYWESKAKSLKPRQTVVKQEVVKPVTSNIEEYYNEYASGKYSKLPISKLNELAKENPFAQLVKAEKTKKNTPIVNTKIIDLYENSLYAFEGFSSYSVIHPVLVTLNFELAKMNETLGFKEQNESMKKKAFRYYQNAYELDVNNNECRDALIRCYEEGIGTEVDLDKAQSLYEKTAKGNSAERCFEIASDYEKEGAGLESIEWYQNCLATEDINDFPGIEIVSLLKLFTKGESDHNGNEIEFASVVNLIVENEFDLNNLNSYGFEDTLIKKIERQKLLTDKTCNNLFTLGLQYQDEDSYLEAMDMFQQCLIAEDINTYPDVKAFALMKLFTTDESDQNCNPIKFEDVKALFNTFTVSEKHFSWVKYDEMNTLVELGEDNKNVLYLLAETNLKKNDFTAAYKCYEKAAKFKELFVMKKLAEMNLNGIGTLRNVNEAIKWFKECAELGDKYSVNELVELTRNSNENIYWIRKGVDFEIPNCFYLLAKQSSGAEALNLYKKAANLGIEEAYPEVGKAYYEEKNYVEAEKWLMKSSKENPANAFLLANILYNGLGTMQNKDEAAKLYEIAANNNNVEAMKVLIDHYESRNSFVESLKYLNKVNDSESQFKIAEYYEYGKGVQQDFNKAYEGYMKVAESNADAAFKVAAWTAEGRGTTRNLEASLPWYELAIKLGKTDAEQYLDNIKKQIEIEKADPRIQFENLVNNATDAESMIKVAQAYELGQNCTQNTAEAIRWYEKASQLGNQNATRKLIEFILANPNNIIDEYLVRLYEQLVATGNMDPVSNFYLGYIYELGKIVPQNSRLAIQWYSRGYQLNDVASIMRLGDLMVEGKIATKDLKGALSCYTKAAGLGDPTAKQKAKEVERQLKPGFKWF